MQSNNKFFDDLAAMMTSAAGAARGMGDEFAQMFRQQGERMANELDLATREELEVVKDLARQALARVDELEERVGALEADLAAAPAKSTAASKPKAKKTAKTAGKSASKTTGAAKPGQ